MFTLFYIEVSYKDYCPLQNFELFKVKICARDNENFNFKESKFLPLQTYNLHGDGHIKIPSRKHC